MSLHGDAIAFGESLEDLAARIEEALIVHGRLASEGDDFATAMRDLRNGLQEVKSAQRSAEIGRKALAALEGCYIDNGPFPRPFVNVRAAE